MSSAQHSHSICVVGSGSFDLFLKVSHFPVEGETLQANSAFIKNGGKGANQAVAAAKLGAVTSFAGQVGQDKEGECLLQEMRDSGVNTGFVRQLSTAQTGQAIITLTEKGDNSIIIVGGANIAYTDPNTLPEEFKQAILSSRFVLLQKEIPLTISAAAAVFAKQNGKLVMLDCGGRDEDIPEELLHSLDFISPNQSELERLLSQLGVAKAPEGQELDIDGIRNTLLKKFPKLIVVLKKGSQGSAVLTSDKYFAVSSISAIQPKVLESFKIVDTTGAGDCFTAAFCVKADNLFTTNEEFIAESFEEKAKKCLLFANAAAFLCITVYGAMPSMPQLSDVEKLLADL